MRSPKDFFAPLAVGASAPLRDILLDLADRLAVLDPEAPS